MVDTDLKSSGFFWGLILILWSLSRSGDLESCPDKAAGFVSCRPWFFIQVITSFFPKQQDKILFLQGLSSEIVINDSWKCCKSNCSHYRCFSSSCIANKEMSPYSIKIGSFSIPTSGFCAGRVEIQAWLLDVLKRMGTFLFQNALSSHLLTNYKKKLVWNLVAYKIMKVVTFWSHNIILNMCKTYLWDQEFPLLYHLTVCHSSSRFFHETTAWTMQNSYSNLIAAFES